MKKYFMAVLGIALALVSVAFTKSPVRQTTNPQWYYTETTTTHQNVPSAYQKLGSQDVSLCIGSGTVRCVIEAPEHLTNGMPDGTPVLTTVTVDSYKP